MLMVVKMSFTEQELDEFKIEASELLEVAEKSLLALDAGGDFKSAYDSVFRSMHNLKGASGMMDLHSLQAHTHELETILTQFKDQSEMAKNYITFFLKGIDAAKMILNGESVNFDFDIEKPTSVSQSNETVPLEKLEASFDIISQNVEQSENQNKTSHISVEREGSESIDAILTSIEQQAPNDQPNNVMEYLV